MIKNGNKIASVKDFELKGVKSEFDFQNGNFKLNSGRK
ncbi:MAG: hypothetical protein KatS3mg068_1461 [Candidatus Sericytochromatia bacterium]|nr:MAG: hypothetical protein KatS3mg068_1461 [Candidatus Sericytochromatia bacterium]